MGYTIGKEWSKEAIIAEFTRLYRQLGRSPKSGLDIPPNLQQASLRYFGSVILAKEAAGIPLLRKYYPKSNIEVTCAFCGKKFTKWASTVGRYTGLDFCSQACVAEYRKGHWGVPFNFNWDDIDKRNSLAYITGAILGDGSIYDGEISLSTVDLEFAQLFSMHLSNVANRIIPPQLNDRREYLATKSRPNCKVQYRTRVWWRKFADFLIEITNNPLKFVESDSEKIMLLKGLWDAEGSLDKGKSYLVRFANADNRLLILFGDLLSHFNVDHHFDEIHCIIRGRQNIGQFYRLIGGATIYRKDKLFLEKLTQPLNKRWQARLLNGTWRWAKT